MTNASKVRCDGKKVRELRKRLSMTQEKLAHMSKVDNRTIQRAEAGEFIQLETIASMADALKVTVGEISYSHFSNAAPFLRSDNGEQNAVVLRHIVSGKELIDILFRSFSGKIECQAEPTANNIDLLASMIEKLDGLVPNPWATPIQSVNMSLAERLRAAVGLTAELAELEKTGIAVFAGTYTARAQVPLYDYDDHCMYIKTNQKYERVTVCRISVNPVGVERVTVKVDDEWHEPAPAQPSVSDDAKDDEPIPF